ncbi:transposase (plasmid) [Deinococcus taeanensis]|nr:zinc ribbon domain-containing protein [Deinococcus taeanensis]UBV44798.1 transposase [Deinococcus taeanensis]
MGWGQFCILLPRTADWAAGKVVRVELRATSQRRHPCGHTRRENRARQPRLRCAACGHGENADRNARQGRADRSGIDEAGGDAGAAHLRRH